MLSRSRNSKNHRSPQKCVSPACIFLQSSRRDEGCPSLRARSGVTFDFPLAAYFDF